MNVNWTKKYVFLSAWQFIRLPPYNSITKYEINDVSNFFNLLLVLG